MKKSERLLTGLVFALLAFFPGWIKAAGEVAPDILLKPNVVEYKSGNMRDPFYQEKKPEVIKKIEEAPVQKKSLPVLKIQGMVWGGNFPQAIINNKIVKIGDKIEDASIVEINKEGVVILFEKQKYSLPSPGVTDLENSFRKPEVNKNPEGGKNAR